MVTKLETPINFAQNLSKIIDKCIDNYTQNNAMSVDAYFDKPIFHPMAEAKYLSSLSILCSTNKISKATFTKKASQSIERLLNNCIIFAGKYQAWGLGFEYKNIPIDEPYLITTSMVEIAILDAVKMGLNDSKTLRLVQSVANGLAYWLQNMNLECDNNISVPIYSPNVREPIFNAAIYAVYALKGAQKTVNLPVNHKVENIANECSEWIAQNYFPKLGWKYSPHNNKVDLIHQCYILNSLAELNDVLSVEEQAINLIGQFSSANGFIDAGDVYSSLDGVFDKTIPVLREIDGVYFSAQQKPARLWSLGEFLVLVSRLAVHGKYKQSWQKYGRQLCGDIISFLESEHVETNYARQTMHATHGLASFLAVLRNQN